MDRRRQTVGPEYLFKRVDGGHGPLWVHDRTAERQALTDFLAIARWRRRHPTCTSTTTRPTTSCAAAAGRGRYGIGETTTTCRATSPGDLYPLAARAFGWALTVQLEGAGAAVYRIPRPATSPPPTRSTPMPGTANLRPAASMRRQPPKRSKATTTTTAGPPALRDWLLVRAWEAGVTPIGAQPVPDVPTLSTTVTRWRRYCPSSPAMPPPASARRNRQRSLRWAAARMSSPRGQAVLAGALTGSTTPVDECGRTASMSSSCQRGFGHRRSYAACARKPQRRVRLTGESGTWGPQRNVFALLRTPAPPGMTDNLDRE